MLDWNKIKSKATELYGEATQKLKQYVPESFSKEKKFVNGITISLALMTMADEKVETEEVITSMDLLKEIDQISALNMTTEAMELYEFHLENLEKAFAEGKTKWVIANSKLLSDISVLKEYPEYPPMIINLLDYMMESDGHVDPLEVAMKQKITDALTK